MDKLADRINSLWTGAIHAERTGLGGAGHTSAMLDLRDALSEKTTWVGEDENRLRLAVRRYLTHYGLPPKAK